MRAVRGNEIAMIFQEPMTSLNPVHTVGDQIAEAMLAIARSAARAALQRAAELLERVGIPDAAPAARELPAPTLRRHAPARHDRHGAGLPARAC